MDNKQETKEFNKKLLIVFFMILTIFATLLVAKSKVLAVSSQMESLKQSDRPNPTYLSLEDLREYYDILCCQHGTALPSVNQCLLSGSYSGESFSDDMTDWTPTNGEKRYEHTIYYQGNDFNADSYSHRTLGYYHIIERHIATPKEAYIIAEMKMELGDAENALAVREYVYDSDGEKKEFTGSLSDCESIELAGGKTAYIVNPTYVLKIDDEIAYYVRAAKDSEGNSYYVYDTKADGSLKKYTGDYKYRDPLSGDETDCIGSPQGDIYYEHGGEIESGSTVASDHGTLYLVNYDMVVRENDEIVYATVSNINSYIQIAWWTTQRGTSNGTAQTAGPNALSKEADAFEDYIVKITGKSTVDNLMSTDESGNLKYYENQSYDFYEDNGTHCSGSVMAPIIDYNPGFDDDADHNEDVNEADQPTPSFDYNENKYIIGPFSLHYTKESVSIPGREKVEFAAISGVKLVTNIGELTLGEDWNFHFLASHVSDEDYIYPNPDEEFYIDINYMEDLTKIEEFSFTFKYMNAGAELDIYDGNYAEVTWTVTKEDYFTTNEDGEDEFDHRVLWLQSSYTENDSQTLAHALKGARWYNYKTCSRKIDLKSSSIKIEKTTYDEEGTEKVPLDKTFHFKVYINDVEYQELTIKTENGYGVATTVPYYWGSENPTPTYKVVELGNNENNGPWEGSLEDGEVVNVTAENYIKPQKGKLEVDKSLLNPTPALENEVFKFKVSVTGNFDYEGSGYVDHNSKNPLLIEFEITGRGEWTSNEFKWYGSAPKYKVEEIIPDGSTYELVNGEISNGNGYIKNSKNPDENPTIATATNTPTTDWTILEVDKRMVSDTAPQPGEIFTFTLTINGNFRYESEDEITEGRNEVYNIELNESNGWTWKLPEKIIWRSGDIPTYTIKEVSFADGTEFYSISDEVKTSKINDFNSKLNPELTKIIVTNTREDKLIGKLKINKIVEGKMNGPATFTFKVKISGKFEYCELRDGVLTKIGDYDESNPFEETVTITIDPASLDTPGADNVVLGDIVEAVPIATSAVPVTKVEDKGIQGAAELRYFRWNEEDGAPQYEVTEEDPSPNYKFVSISNGQVTYTSTRTIKGSLNGVSLKTAITEEVIETPEGEQEKRIVIKAGQVVVTCINSGESSEPKMAHIVIIKESTNEQIDDYVFYFKVTISGTFRYYDKINEVTGEKEYTQYTNETLVLDGTINDVEAVCGGEDWISELIEWDENDPNPTYTVEEISIPANVKFLSISNREKTSDSPKIEGTIVEGAENNYITAINEPDTTGLEGSLRISKKTTSDLKGKPFYFKLTVKGEFDYDGKHYDNEHPYVLDKIEVLGNGNPWISGIFTWNEEDGAPIYEVIEHMADDTDADGNRIYPDGTEFDFKSISNEKYVWTEGGSSGITEPGCVEVEHGVQGHLNLTKAVKITAINYGDGEQPTNSHIEITKEVLNEKLKGRTFYFDVEITAQDAFRYYDLEDPTKVVEYKAHSTLLIENVPVVADEKDWISGLVEWGYNDESQNPPTYKITEKYENFYDNNEENGIKSVSIRNDTEIKNFGTDYNLTNKDDVPFIEGTVNGGVTHIIAVNDEKDEKSVKGKIVIEKKALSELIEGEEFKFKVTITGKFKYDGKDYRKLDITDIIIKALNSSQNPTAGEEGVTGTAVEKWISKDIEWYEKDGAPTYTVTEETATFSDGTKFVSIRNAYQTNSEPVITGVVEPNFNNWVLAENTFDGYNKGRLQIHKVLEDEEGNEINGIEFTFNVSVQFYKKDGTNDHTETQTITVTSGGYWRSGWYVWSKNCKTPTYHIEEADNNGYEVTIDNPDGDLIAQDVENQITGVVSVRAKNKYQEENKAQIEVKKIPIANDKVTEDDINVSFTALVKITGTFTYNGKAYNDDTLTLKILLSKDKDWKWTSKEIKWNGDEAPIYTVEEPASEMPDGWKLVSVNVVEASNSDNVFEDGELVKVEITNKWDWIEIPVLTMKLGGKVWDDTNRTADKYTDTLENGKIDEGEPGIPNAKVTIHRTLVDKATGEYVKKLEGVYVYDENNLETRVDNVTYTDESGNWKFGAVSVPAFTEDEKSIYDINRYCVTYGVEFEYDGQTYEPTEFLATAGDGPKSYIGADASNNMYSNVGARWNKMIESSTSERDNYLNDSMAIDKQEDRIDFNKTFEDVQGKTPIDDDGNTEGMTGTGKDLHYSSVDSVSFFNSDNSRKISTLETVDDENNLYDELKITASTYTQNETASTSINLTYPFYNHDLYSESERGAWHLRGWDKLITDEFTIVYKFEAVYNYCLSINLGLIEREAADVAVEKDLTEALVVVNGKALKYKFNSAIDLEDPDNSELLYKQLAVADAQIEYTLGLYKGDYYYRASVYDGTDAGSALNGFYTGKLNLPSISYSEMEIYLTYTINVYNQSATYDVKISELVDYYDGTFKLITSDNDDDRYRYVQTLNGEKIDNKIEVAKPSKIKFGDDPTEYDVTWASVENDIDGSDEVKYNKITTSAVSGSDGNRKLATGEKASITVTFMVNKKDKVELNDSINKMGVPANVEHAIELGKKHNLAEVAKFTSYYSDKSENRWSEKGQVSGRVDEDSAPDNVNIRDYNEKAYYEDDTDSAPIITVELNDGGDSRRISGLVWDDAQTKDVGYGQVVGDGLYNPEQGDKLINGLTVEAFESISVPTDNTTADGEKIYEEYQFAWPTGIGIAELGGHSIEELTGFKQSIKTVNGEYVFENLPAGNYKVRYVYGDKNIPTGNSDSIVVYNGQDYKTTAYQIGFDNDKNADGYLDNEWHDITNSQLGDLRVNDARDDEARRLYISAKSEMLTYENTSRLAKADDKSLSDSYNPDDPNELKELFGEYNPDNPVKGTGFYMYAETAKINLGIENIYDIGYTTNTIGDTTASVDVGTVSGKAIQNGKDVGTPEFKYDVKNVDCGIEERSQTKITLDKQIKEIILSTSDLKVILDAVYDISYTMKSDGSIVSTVTLNREKSISADHIASLNRRGSNQQGYRYVIADSQILQGAQIKVQYQITAFNMSETDRISKDLEILWQTEGLDTTNPVDYENPTRELKTDIANNSSFTKALDKVSTNLYTEKLGRVYNGETGYASVGYGTYFGSVYYLGSQGVGARPDETIVKTKIHELIDYVDPDIEVKTTDNVAKNQSWANADLTYLMSNKLLDKHAIQVLDSTGKIKGTAADITTLDAGDRYSIVSDKLQEYCKDESKNNIMLAISDGSDREDGTNPGFIKYLEPYMADSNTERSTATISLNVGRFYTSELDANDIDNIAEIIKVENTAGRRDARNIAGNVSTYKLGDDGEPISIYTIATAGKEKDASATEVITLSPPTGLSPEESRMVQLAIVILISVTVVAVAIIVIKKKVLNRN